MKMVFGDFNSFLEISFSINVMFRGWGKLSERMIATGFQSLKRRAEPVITEATARQEEGTANAVRQIIEGSVARFSSNCQNVRKWCNRLATSVIIAIAIALFIVPSDSNIGTGAKWLIGITIAPAPLALGTGGIVFWWRARRNKTTLSGISQMLENLPEVNFPERNA